jgi:hypothetical protein
VSRILSLGPELFTDDSSRCFFPRDIEIWFFLKIVNLWGKFWENYERIVGEFCENFGVIFKIVNLGGKFWENFGRTMGEFWENFGVIFSIFFSNKF